MSSSGGVRAARLNNKVDQPVGNEHHPPRLATHEVAAHVLPVHRSRESPVAVDPRRHLNPVSSLAVDLDHEGDLLSDQCARVVRRPGLPVDRVPAADPGPQLLREVRGERGEEEDHGSRHSPPFFA